MAKEPNFFAVVRNSFEKKRENQPKLDLKVNDDDDSYYALKTFYLTPKKITCWRIKVHWACIFARIHSAG